MGDRTKEIRRHLSPEEIDEAINDAQQADEARLVRRLNCIKNLYAGDTLAEAAWRVGVDESAVSRWSDDWNEDGVDGLRPSFGGGRPPKLSNHQKERLQRVLAEYQPWTTAEVQSLIEQAFDVSYSRRHTSRLLRSFDMNYAVPRPRAPDRPDDAEDTLDERLQEALAELTVEHEEEDDDLVADGGIVVGFLDEAWPQPTDNRRRLWAFGTPVLEKETPTKNFEDAVLGYYALNGNSVVKCKPDVSKESVAEFFMRIREQNPSRRILLVCDNFSSHFANLVDHVVESLNITRVALPAYSPDLNPIEPIWNDVHRELSPQDAEDIETFRDHIRSAYRKYAERMSYASHWIDEFLDAERLRKLRP
jgi:transposase